MIIIHEPNGRGELVPIAINPRYISSVQRFRDGDDDRVKTRIIMAMINGYSWFATEEFEDVLRMIEMKNV